MQNLKVANQVLFRDLFEGYNLGHCLSESSEKMLQRGKRGDRIYTKWFVCFFSGGKKKQTNMQLKVRRLLLITKKRHLKFMILMFFCVWEEDLRSLKLFIRYALQFSRANI